MKLGVIITTVNHEFSLTEQMALTSYPAKKLPKDLIILKIH